MAEYIEREYVLKCMNDSYKSAGISAEAKAKMTRWLNKAPSADVIERDEWIRMGAELAAMHGSDATSQELEKAYFNGVEEGLRKARKTGKWILVKDWSNEVVECGEKYWVCSLCGCGSDSYDTTYHTSFCPNCGADMREES